MITDNELLPIKQWVLQKLGIKVHDHQQVNLANTIHKLMVELDITSMNELLACLYLNDPRIVNNIIKTITVQESYFFRDQSLFIYLKDKALPELIKKRRAEHNLTINIWSAGCAHGEEIYSIAALLFELLPDLKNWRIYLFGSDIQEEAVTSAKQACFSKSSLRATPDYEQQRYFTSNNGRYQLKPEIQSLAQFGIVNLASNHYPLVHFDIILCRNVFIYFSLPAIEHALTKFKGCLCHGGYLFLGASDFVTYHDNSFKQKTESGITYFIKSPPPAPEILEAAPQPLLQPEIKRPTYFEMQTHKSSLLNEIRVSLESRQYQQTLKLIDNYINEFGDSELLYQYKAAALLEMGDMHTALEYCNKVIKAAKSNPYVFFIKAMIAMDRGFFDEAKQTLQQALQISPKFVEAYYHLGLLLLRQNLIKEGLKTLHEALNLAKMKDGSEKVFGSPTESIKDIVQAIENDIQFYQGRTYG